MKFQTVHICRKANVYGFLSRAERNAVKRSVIAEILHTSFAQCCHNFYVNMYNNGSVIILHIIRELSQERALSMILP